VPTKRTVCTAIFIPRYEFWSSKNVPAHGHDPAWVIADTHYDVFSGGCFARHGIVADPADAG
jgi:hypothetical protein